MTDVWCDSRSDAQAVSKASLIPTAAARPEDFIGAVDRVIVATETGSEQVRRCRPFVKAGLPVFVDNPLVDSEGDMGAFTAWVERGAAVLSSSAMRYRKAYRPYHAGGTHEPGELRLVTLDEIDAGPGRVA